MGPVCYSSYASLAAILNEALDVLCCFSAFVSQLSDFSFLIKKQFMYFSFQLSSANTVKNRSDMENWKNM